jgi:hypothetical protein
LISHNSVVIDVICTIFFFASIMVLYTNVRMIISLCAWLNIVELGWMIGLYI